MIVHLAAIVGCAAAVASCGNQTDLPRRRRGRGACPCHGSTFELDGSVTAGPAQSPLDVFAARYDATNDVVTVTV